jgi:hypothetical protein
MARSGSPTSAPISGSAAGAAACLAHADMSKVSRTIAAEHYVPSLFMRLVSLSESVIIQWDAWALANGLTPLQA